MKNKRKIIGSVLCSILVFLLLPISSVYAKEEESIIRIGYDTNSNFIQERNGEFYGYGVEYLNKIAEYTGKKYEYIKVENWQDSFDKLRNGTIDFICTVHYTKEKAEEFLFCKIPLGYEATLLYAAPHSNISYQDYEAFANSKVGLLLESYSMQDFISYAQKKQFGYEAIYFESEREMRKALENGEIDLLAIGSRYGTSDLSLVDRLGVNAFYCITNPNNALLMGEVENVLQQIMFDDPTFEGNLNEKYFGHTHLSHTPPYTKEELAFIENVGTIKVKILMNQRPSCYEADGELRGIWVEYLKLLSEKTGIQFQIENGIFDENSESIYNDLLAENYLILRTNKAVQHSKTENIIISSSLMDVDISYIELQESFVKENFKINTLALTQDLSYVVPMLLEQNDMYEIVYYNKAQDCIDAVLSGKASVAILSTLHASYLMQKPEYADKLTQIQDTNYSNQVHLIASEENDMLMSIINKAISHVSKEEKNTLVTKELLVHPYVINFGDIWYQYWEWIILAIVSLAVFLGIYMALNKRMAKMQIEKHDYELLQKKIQLDELTGLYNRTYFYELAQEKIENATEEMCIVVMDICNFKVVNELYGMHTGDGLLIEIAEHLKQIDAEHPMLPARFMSDHYYMCLSKKELESGILPKRFQTSLEEVDVRVVYGIYNVDSLEEVSVNVMCDRALLAAHSKNHTYKEYMYFYDNKEHKRIMQEQEIEKDMEQALEEEQFYIVVQPKYNPNVGKIVGGESLVRWQHPTKGMISPGLFIPVFEKNGFIIQLDYFVWEETCKLLSKRKHAGKEYVPISINVSRAHFYGTELMNKLQELIQKYNLDTKDLELEITESLCGEEPDIIYDKIRTLQENGFKIAMDDFGSGYSSLNMLKEMPLDILKMDLRFLDGDEKKGRHILKSLIEMAHTMELKVVVEGVELLSQVEFLCQFECSLQGYYFSKPIIVEEFEQILDKNV